jgi:hypothetical protein
MTTTTTTTGGADLLSPLWNMDDATIQAPGALDLRLTSRWGTGADDGDSGDDFAFQHGVLWGMAENLEGFAITDWVIGEGKVDGNGDTTLGMTWRFSEANGNMPTMALQGSARIPTGYHSSGVDGEGRLIISHDYDSGIRSHVNVFARTINGDNDPSMKDFNYGAVFGADGPLCSDGAVRWVADYMWQHRTHDGGNNDNIVELGWEWQMEAARRFGMSVQISVDRASQSSDFGAGFTYSHGLTF